MDNRTMMELDPKLDGQFNELVKYCKASGAIDQDLYIEGCINRSDGDLRCLIIQDGSWCKDTGGWTVILPGI